MPVTLGDGERELVERVRTDQRAAEDEHRQFREHAAEFYSLYRGLQDFRSEYGVERDRDVVVRRAQKEWGAELFIPIAFRTVETIVPRMLAHRPRMNPLPEDEQAFGTVENMRLIVDKQQRQIGYETELQKICKDGLIYGLGVQKVGWRKEYRRPRRGIQPSTYDPNKWVGTPEDQLVEKCIFDDAYAEWVDPFAFMWDPYAHEISHCEFVIHRLYRSEAYVRKMIERRAWRSKEWDPTCVWTLEDLLSSSATTQEDQLLSERRAVEGYSTTRSPMGGRHEVWEYHDGDQVIVVLNGEFPVLVAENPMPDGSLPFQVFRPTVIGGRMVGIGEIEPIRDLQYELNTIRGQRVDAVTMALNRGYFFDESMVNQDDLQIGPNIGVPVNGSPREALWPMQIGDVPTSAYQESAAIAGDIDSVTGVSDETSGGSAGQQTATGAQLVAQAASIRIQNKSKLFGQQIIIPGGNAFVLLNQTHILTQRVVPYEATEGVWSKVNVGPGELQGLMSMNMDDGSTMAENVPQMRSDAQAWMGLRGDDRFDPTKVAEKIAHLLGEKRPETIVLPPEPQIPVDVIEQALVLLKVPPEAFGAALDQVSLAQDPNAQEQPTQEAPA